MRSTHSVYGAWCSGFITISSVSSATDVSQFQRLSLQKERAAPKMTVLQNQINARSFPLFWLLAAQLDCGWAADGMLVVDSGVATLTDSASVQFNKTFKHARIPNRANTSRQTKLNHTKMILLLCCSQKPLLTSGKCSKIQHSTFFFVQPTPPFLEEVLEFSRDHSEPRKSQQLERPRQGCAGALNPAQTSFS